MKFRKLALCVIIGIFVINFPSVRAFAAETAGISDNQVQESKTEEGSAETNINTENVGTTGDIAATDISLTSTDTIESDTAKEDAATEDVNAEDPAAQDSQISEEDAVSEDKTSEESEEDADQEEEKTVKEEVKYTKGELRLLSALIFCEAQGESYNGKLAVGIVVMNRKNSSRFPDTIKGVIYQKYQFSPVSNGSLKKVLEDYDNGKFTSAAEKECIKAAKAALNGTTTITVSGKKKDFSKYLYFSGRLRGYTFKLGNHQFK